MPCIRRALWGEISEVSETSDVCCNSGGWGEVLVGAIETHGGLPRIRFMSKAVVNDPRMIASARMFELEGDSLRYEMEMQTTAVEGLMSHLRVELKRVR